MQENQKPREINAGAALKFAAVGLLRVLFSKRNVLFLAVSALGAAFYLSARTAFYDRPIRLPVGTFIVTLATALALRAILLVRIPAESVFCRNRDGKKIAFVETMWIWRWNRWREDSLLDRWIEYGDTAYCNFEVRTDGSPPLSCRMPIVRGRDAESLILLTEFIVKNDIHTADSYADSSETPFEGLVKQMAYEFVKEKRSELDELWDPLDGRQQRKYHAILQEFLRSRIGGGTFIAISGYFAKFDIAPERKAVRIKGLV
jgi:hypothetical protein